MVASTCQHSQSRKFGKDRKGNPRRQCTLCHATWTERGVKPIGDMQISVKEATTALGMLLEGMSIRATARLTGLDRGTIGDLILVVGENCRQLLETKVCGVEAKDIQLDEIWSFIGCKEKNRLSSGRGEENGDSWTWTGIDRDTKLILAFQVGQRDGATCGEFLGKLNRATTGKCQVSSDGFGAYTYAVPFILGNRVDFAQLIKDYAAVGGTHRYSPAKIISSTKKAVFGDPDPDKICTSHVERFNLSIRMHLRRFTRLTNGHSKLPAHHEAMQAIFFAWYNFSRKHETLKGRTPAMAAGIADAVWTIRELLENAASL